MQDQPEAPRAAATAVINSDLRGSILTVAAAAIEATQSSLPPAASSSAQAGPPGVSAVSAGNTVDGTRRAGGSSN